MTNVVHHRVERALVNFIGGFYDLPLHVSGAACLAFTAACYFVLPPIIGIGAVLLAAFLPWYEERLKRRIEFLERKTIPSADARQG